MTREEAITALGDINNLLWGMREEEQKYYSEALDMAISALSENKGEWIPVTERLPKNDKDVLVYDDSDIFVAWYSKKIRGWGSLDERFDEYTPIIAWQPLPEPYKAEKGGE